MKRLFTLILCIGFMTLSNDNSMAAGISSEASYAQADQGSDFHVISDRTKGDTRTVIASTSELVCSKQVEVRVDVKTKKITYCKFTGGCPGNTLGVSRLVIGLTVREAVSKLRGIPCGNRPTSCPDQLARVLETLNLQ